VLTQPVIFVSDIHLHPSRPETARLFNAFLAGPARAATALYILGDLFDTWAGDDDIPTAFNAGICAALHELSRSGTQLFFVPGNRDFLAGPRFAAAAGLAILGDETVVSIAGTPTLILHGDTLCTDDHEYQDFRALVRSAQWQAEFLAQPLHERKTAIEVLRQRSIEETRKKSMAIVDVNADAVLAAFARHRVARMIHGHTHRPARHTHGAGATLERWVLPEWHNGGGYLACAAAGCHAMPFPAQ